MAASKGSSAKKTGTKKAASGNKKTGSRKGGSGNKRQASSVVLLDEISFLAALAVSLLLLFSNLHLCGSVGEVLRAAMRGMMGTLGYIFPFFLFGVTIFMISNRRNLKAMLKLLAVVLAYWLLCGILQLFCSEVPDYIWELADWFDIGKTVFSGGVLGGVLYALLQPALGIWGMAVVLAAGMILLTVLVTGRSFFQPVSKSSRRIYSTARADVRRKKASYDEYRSQVRERKQQEREQEQAQREENRRMAQIRLEQERKEQERKEQERKAQEDRAGAAALSHMTGAGAQMSVAAGFHDIGTVEAAALGRSELSAGGETLYQLEAPGGGEILNQPEISYQSELSYSPEAQRQPGMPRHADAPQTAAGPAQEETPEALYKEDSEADWLSTMSGEIDRIFIRRDIRTLDELDAMEQSDGPAQPEEPGQWNRPGHPEEPGRLNEPAKFEDPEPADFLDMTQWEEPEDPDRSAAGRSAAFSDEDAVPASGFSFKKSAPQVDTRTVTTAAGKVIEVEVKPEDLVDAVSAPSGLFAKSGLPESAETGSGETAGISHSDGTAGIGYKQKMADISHSSGIAGISQSRNDGMGTGGVGMAGTGQGQQPSAALPPVFQRPRPYTMPSVDLLKPVSGPGGRNRDFELKETAAKLQQTLKSFGVGVNVTNISCGPSVTRYEITPEQGVKVSKIVSLTDDIKLNLAAADIRIEAPIPGKSAVGIEVPNKEKVTVFFREMIASAEFQNHPSRLAFAVGKDLSGRIIVTDLAGMPHLLIAGATGSGKSVCINTLIMSLLYKAKPDEVKLIMVDPKVVELSVYNGIPHLLIPVVTDPKKAAGALNWAVAEMTDRYNKFAEHGVRDLKSYNAKMKRTGTDENGEEPRLLPQIVIIVDELADLMMVAPGEVEDAICRLAQLARAAGIHLVLATQRPSVNVITGLIKANMPSRIAFAVSSGVDSRTILDMNGAEKLLGKGDMLFSPSGYPKPVRLQGAFVSDTEVSDVVQFIADNGGGPAYQSAVAMQMSAEQSMLDGGRSGSAERDAYFVQAGLFVIEKEKASSGMLQRAFKIGFNRAARIVDQLAQAGVVGEEEGTKPRKILMTKAEFETYLGENQIQ